MKQTIRFTFTIQCEFTEEPNHVTTLKELPTDVEYWDVEENKRYENLTEVLRDFKYKVKTDDTLNPKVMNLK